MKGKSKAPMQSNEAIPMHKKMAMEGCSKGKSSKSGSKTKK